MRSLIKQVLLSTFTFGVFLILAIFWPIMLPLAIFAAIVALFYYFFIHNSTTGSTDPKVKDPPPHIADAMSHSKTYFPLESIRKELEKVLDDGKN